jgi:hypothetical protein
MAALPNGVRSNLWGFMDLYDLERLLKKFVFQLNFWAAIRYRGRRVGNEPAMIARPISTSDQIAMGTVA